MLLTKKIIVMLELLFFLRHVSMAQFLSQFIMKSWQANTLLFYGILTLYIIYQVSNTPDYLRVIRYYLFVLALVLHSHSADE